MKTLTYWIADCLDDSPCYSIRAKTKKAVIAQTNSGEFTCAFGAPRKVTVEYKDTFTLLLEATGEGGIYEGPRVGSENGIAEDGFSSETKYWS